MDAAFKYAEVHGLETEAQYPYNGWEATCAATSAGGVKLSTYTDVAANDPEALAEAVAKGPVAVGMDASGNNFQHYRGGIMSIDCGTSLNHGVLVVGYGAENGADYWLLKNSWGPVWGEQGFFRMKRDMTKKGPGFCGLQKAASQPVV